MKLIYSNELVPENAWDLTGRWNEALPIGNGRLGAMVFGLVQEDVIQLNEDSVWSGGYQERNNRDTLKYLSELRDLVRNGEIEKAEELILPAFSGVPSSMRVYQTMGTLALQFPHRHHTNYSRVLDLEKAVCRVSYDVEKAGYTREYFTSFSDDIFVMRLTAAGGNPVSFTASLTRGIWVNNSGAKEGIIYIKSGANGLDFAAALGQTHTGGRVCTMGDRLVVEDVEEITLFLDCQTTVRQKGYFEKVFENIKQAGRKGYTKLKEEHIKRYNEHFSTMDFKLTESSGTCTNELLEKCEENLKEITQLYYAFSRYLLICSSRKGTFPATLQGIWCKDMDPPWGSRYTININTQMNYWPADMCNMSAFYEPYFFLLKNMYKNGKSTAKTMYNCRGFTAHHNTNIFADTAPQDYWISATPWVMGAGWMATHIYEHYSYTLDKQFLEDHFYILEEACIFFVDFMEKSGRGEYICNPTLSPENSYKLPDGKKGVISPGCTMDSQIISLLMSHYFKALKELGIKGKYADEIKEVYTNLPGTKIASNGTIREWYNGINENEEHEEYKEHKEYKEAEPGHRHISHLFALYPGEEIRKNETLKKAAKKTIERRLEHGGAHTGWSRAWIMNFCAVLNQENELLFHFKELLQKSTLPNLLDNHPPFQIDGNFGALTALTMMYVQSMDDDIFLLPACPPVFRCGKIEGILAKGGVEVALYFEENDKIRAVLLSKFDIVRNIHYKKEVKRLELEKGKKVMLEYPVM